MSKLLRGLILVAAVIYFIKLWAVDALQMMSADQWSSLADYAIGPLVAMCVAYLVVSYINYLSARYLAMHPVVMPALNDDGTPSVVDKHTAVINALLKREDLAKNLRVNWDQVRDVVAAEDGLPTEIGVPGGNTPVVSSTPVGLQQ